MMSPQHPTILQSIETGDMESLRRLLLQGIDFRQDDDTPLVYAVQCKQPDAVKLLLIAGSDPNASYGTPLISAAKNNRIDIAKLLLRAGVDISNMENAALRVAVRHGHTQMIEWLNNNVSQFDPATQCKL